MTDKMANTLKRYADNAVMRFEELGLPASITVFIETDEKIFQACSLRRGDINSIVINTVIRDINYLVKNVEFLQPLQHTIKNK